MSTNFMAMDFLKASKEDTIDVVLMGFGDYEKVRYDNIFSNAGIEEEFIEYNKLTTKCIAVIQMMHDTLKYIERPNSNYDEWILTDKGRAAKKIGGHFAYLKALEKSNEISNERQERKDVSDKLDLQIKKFQVKTKLLPYAISFAALVISICSYFKPEKKQQDLQLMQQQIQELQKHEQVQDSLFRRNIPRNLGI